LKILIVKPSSLGDVVLSLPVLRSIKRHLPESEIYWWIDAGLAPLLEGDPDLTGLLLFDRRRWRQPSYWAELLRTTFWVRKQKFDWVLDLQGLARSGTFAWLANAGLTIGMDEPREGARGFYDHLIRRPSFRTHAVDWYLSLLPMLDVPAVLDLPWLPARPAIAAEIRRKWPTDGARWLAIQPGARWVNKRWPIEHYVELLKRLADSALPHHFVILGSAEDRPLGEKLQEALPERCLNLTGQTSLLEMVEWIRLCDLMVTNDTGPMHIAAALGTPVVAIFGPTEPWRTGPYGQIEHALQLDLACAPCLRRTCRTANPCACLRDLPPASVFEAVRNRLKAQPRLAAPRAVPSNALA
jgi:lipopolysaccharide heptosyltransferase II